MSKKTAANILAGVMTILWAILVSAHAAMIYPGVPSVSVFEKVSVTIIYTGLIGFALLLLLSFLTDWMVNQLGWGYRIIEEDGKITILPPG